MPSSATITTTDFVSFSANTRAKATEVNGNFDIYRGHIIPVEPNTSAANDGSYDLGSDEHRWRTLYCNTVDLETSTTTSTLILEGNASQTLGSMNMVIEGQTVLSASPTQLLVNITTGGAATTASMRLISSSFNVFFAGSTALAVVSGGIVPYLKSTATANFTNGDTAPTAFATIAALDITKSHTNAAVQLHWQSEATATPSTMSGMWVYTATGTGAVTRTYDIEYIRDGSRIAAYQFQYSIAAAGLQSGFNVLLPPFVDYGASTITSAYDVRVKMSAGDLHLWINDIKFRS